MKNLATPIFQQAVKHHPTIDEPVNGIAPLTGAKQIRTCRKLSIT